MTDRTGMARGNLRPVIYFQSSSGYCVLAPQEVGHDLSLARRMYSERYRDWEWREAGTWTEVSSLQSRLQQQALDERKQHRDVSMASYDNAKKKTAEELRQRMQSAGCDEYEREFIRLWLDMAPDKRTKYEQRFMERQNYLWACEMDAGRKVEERMPSQPGDVWRGEAQQKA